MFQTLDYKYPIVIISYNLHKISNRWVLYFFPFHKRGNKDMEKLNIISGVTCIGNVGGTSFQTW